MHNAEDLLQKKGTLLQDKTKNGDRTESSKKNERLN